MNQKTMYDYYPLNLAMDVLDGSNLARVYIPGIGTALYLLTERERGCLADRYERGLTYDAIAKEQGVTRERIRQITMKALRKLKSPGYVRKIIGISLEEHKAELSARLAEKDAIMAEKEKTLIAYNAAVGALKGQKPPEMSVALQPIENLDLSVRSYNCLRRAGKQTIGDVAETTYDELLKVRNLGRRSLDEIISKMREVGFEIKGADDESEQR